MSHKLSGLGLLLTTAVCFSTSVNAEEFLARLNGFKEVGGIGAAQTGAIFSDGIGKLELTVRKTSIDYALTYSGTGTPVGQAHIHFGREHVGGGIIAFLCTNLGNGP